MANILINLNGKIKYLKYLNLILNIVFYSCFSLIRNKLYIFGKFKVINYRILINLSLNLTINDRE